jgi:hypothetical protein
MAYKSKTHNQQIDESIGQLRQLYKIRKPGEERQHVKFLIKTMQGMKWPKELDR